MSMNTEDRQMDFDGVKLDQLGEIIISYTKFLIDNDAYTISDTCETIEKPNSINIEKNSTDLDNQPPKDVITADTQVFYRKLADFLSENENLLGAEAIAF